MPPASQNAHRTHLALSSRSIALIVVTVASVVAVTGIIGASIRVIGWMLAAASIAALLEPLVDLLTRYVRRGLAVLLTMLIAFGAVGGIAFLTVNDVVHELHVLQESAPERAHQLEKSERFGSVARSFKLERRTRALVKDIPSRLRGGSNADALRAAGTRGVAYLATTVLTVFLIVNGRKLVIAAVEQIRDEKRRTTLRTVLREGGRRGVRYTTGSLGMAAVAGVLVAATARIVDVPGAAPLSLWAALWDVVPMLGAVIGGLPVAILAAASSPAAGVAVLVVFLAYEVFEAMVLQRRLERRSVHVGPFLTLVVASVGLELYGIGGALFALFATSVAVGLFEVWREETAEDAE
ncbi:MAG TPA: AI-2E family transporter [Vicinamibacterales bacterium]|nr:AI-2E family transporter [Vicinamibacterales bacterium]